MTCARVTPPVSSSVELYAAELEIVSITGNLKGHLKFSLVELSISMAPFGKTSISLARSPGVSEGLKNADW